MNEITYVDNGRIEYCPLWWHKEGLRQTATGYGLKLTTPYKTEYNGRMYRVYAACVSNVGSLYILSKGKRLVLRNEDISEVTH
ncbi:hypothetical protein LCGC14_2005430 [marine sediment metagenome]|uniref:Uncharacterized protein n=1 Tax=marine sediment metagenome TaxID=412755 RepID=A0A0F9HFC5_9ZZZZ